MSQSSSSGSPWNVVKAARFGFAERWLADKSSFYADVVFSSGGRGYWGDLLRGFMYCDCDALLSDDIHPVDLYSIPLPPIGCCHDSCLDRDVVTTNNRAESLPNIGLRQWVHVSDLDMGPTTTEEHGREWLM